MSAVEALQDKKFSCFVLFYSFIYIFVLLCFNIRKEYIFNPIFYILLIENAVQKSASTTVLCFCFYCKYYYFLNHLRLIFQYFFVFFFSSFFFVQHFFRTACSSFDFRLTYR